MDKTEFWRLFVSSSIGAWRLVDEAFLLDWQRELRRMRGTW